MSTLGVTNSKDYPKTGKSKTYGTEKFVEGYAPGTSAPEYQQTTNDMDYPKTGKLMKPDHKGHQSSENTSDGFVASPASSEYQQVTNDDQFPKNGDRNMFPSEGKGPNIREPMPKDL